MNKTVTITLNGIIFHIEEHAYEQLRRYLEAIRAHFDRTGEGAEIISDIESNIAEKFTAKITPTRQVITAQDVTEIIEVMGTVADITGNQPAAGTVRPEEPTSESSIKKLYRNPDDVIIAGVCSGLAEYFDVDPILVRLLFFVSIFFGGTGVILYLVLWMIMPVAKTSSQKLEMQGEPVTLANLEQAVKEKLTSKGPAGDGIRNLIALPFRLVALTLRALVTLLRRLVPLVGMLVGIVLIFGMLAALVGLTFVTAVLLFNTNSPYIISDLPIHELISIMPYHLSVIAGYLVAVIPVMVLLLLGISLGRRKNIITLPMFSVLFGVWMLSIIAVGVIAIDAAPRIEQKMEEHRAAIASQVKNFPVEKFTRVAVRGGHTVQIVQGDTISVEASGSDATLQRLDVSVNEEGTLIVRNKEPRGICIFCTYHSASLVITAPRLDGYGASGAVKAEVSGFTGDSFELDLSGASRAEIQTKANSLDVELNGASQATIMASSTQRFLAMLDGASRLTMSGLTATSTEVSVSGASAAILRGTSVHAVLEADGGSRITADELSADTVKAFATGSSKIEVRANTTLEAEADGAGRVYYLGTPAVTEHVSGAGRVEAR